MMIEGSERYSVAGFEGRERVPRSKELRQLLETGKGKETRSPLESPGRKATLTTPCVRLICIDENDHILTS